MTLVYLLAGVLLLAIGVLGLLDLVQRIQQRVRVYRVGKMLQEVEKEAYQERPQRIVRGVSRSVWEAGDDDAA